MLNQKRLDISIGIFLVLFLLSLIFIAVPIDFPYIFNFDESMELIREHLLSRDYIFFKEVWNDHPLGLPAIFQLGSNLFEISLTSARYIVLFFSVINILLFYFMMRLECDRASSTISALILLLSFQYVPLSGVILKEIPSLCLVTLSLLLMSLYAKQRGNKSYLFLFFCSLSFVLSMEIKLSGITIIPTLIVIGLSSSKIFRKKIQDAATWTIATSLIFILFSVTFLPFSYSSLIASHSNASAKLAVTDPSLTLLSLLKTAIQYDTIYVILAILAIASIIWTDRKYRLLPPLLWLGFNLLRFSLISPVWPNYYIHLALPAAWTIGLFLDDLNIESLFRKFKIISLKSPKFLFRVFLVLVTFFQFSFNTAKIVTARNPRRYQHPVLVTYNWMARNNKTHPAQDFFEQHRGSNKVLLTDNPFFIHEFELDTPPETAILSRKRLNTENLDGEFILKVIKKRNPDFVLLDRFSEIFLESEMLSDFLKNNYVEYPLSDEKVRLYEIAK